MGLSITVVDGNVQHEARCAQRASRMSDNEPLPAVIASSMANHKRNATLAGLIIMDVNRVISTGSSSLHLVCPSVFV